MNKWLDYLWLNRFQWYRKWRKGSWYKHKFTNDAFELCATWSGTWWARYSDINRYSIVIDNEKFGGEND
jgi:hypothetical protein